MSSFTPKRSVFNSWKCKASAWPSRSFVPFVSLELPPDIMIHCAFAPKTSNPKPPSALLPVAPHSILCEYHLEDSPNVLTRSEIKSCESKIRTTGYSDSLNNKEARVSVVTGDNVTCEGFLRKRNKMSLMHQHSKSMISSPLRSELKEPSQDEVSTLKMDCDDGVASETSWTAKTTIRAKDSTENRLEAPALSCSSNEPSPDYSVWKPLSDTSTSASGRRRLRRNPSMEVHVGCGGKCLIERTCRNLSHWLISTQTRMGV